MRQLTDATEAVVAEYTYDAFGNVIAQTTGGGMAYHPVEEDEPLNKAGLVLLLCFVSGLGFVTVRSKPVRRIGGRRGVMLILVLSTALITISIPTSMAIETDETGNPYGFTGESQFGEADDLIFLRARYYSPSTGRFISRDPIHYAGGINLYGYCQNNPVNKKDPTGLKMKCVPKVDWEKVKNCLQGIGVEPPTSCTLFCMGCLKPPSIYNPSCIECANCLAEAFLEPGIEATQCIFNNITLECKEDDCP